MADRTGTKVIHPAVPGLLKAVKDNRLSRRSFLAQASALGVGTATAYGMLGLPAPQNRLRAQEDDAVLAGATITCQMLVYAAREPRLFDQSEMGNVLRGTLENLVRYTEDLTLEPWLLESWTVSDDARQITLSLRPGTTWSNGEPLTADQIVFNFKQWCDRSTPGNSMADRMVALIDPATGQAREGAIVATDPMTVVLTLEQPDITIIPGLSDYPALIIHPDFSADTPDFPQALVGTGPYALVSLVPGQRAVLLRRDGWWGGSVPVERIIYEDLGIDPSAHISAFEEGRIDLVYDSTGVFVDIFDSMGLTREEILTGATLVARVNRAAVPEGHPYHDIRVRRALALAVDNAVILELGYSNLGAVAENHHVGPMHPDYAAIDTPAPDPRGAMELLRQAGAADFQHELISLDDDWNRDSADAIAAQLRDAGIKVKRTVLSTAEYWADWRTHPFSTTPWNMRPLGLQILRLGYASDGVWNETGFNSASFDRLLNEAKAVIDPDERRPLMRALEEELIADGTIIQPYWRKLFLHHTDRLAGVVRHPTNEHHHDLWRVVG